MIADILTAKTPSEVAAKAADPPDAIGDIKEYSELFTQPELFQRIHVHLVCVRPKGVRNSEKGLFVMNMLGFKSFLYDMNASATVETYGDKCGSTEWFPIGKHEFLPCKKNPFPVWDARSMILGKKGSENTQGIKFTVKNDQEKLFQCNLPAAEFPAIGAGWKEFVYSPEETAAVRGVELVYQIRITDCKESISGKDALASYLQDSETLSYSEEVIKGELEVDNALLQCWRQNEKSSKAVLWIPGRNDCFMHPHVAKALFTGKGYDLYVLNYSSMGMCRKRGWIDNSLHNSHNRIGDFDLYLSQIDGAINIMKSSGYDRVLGYIHSTGGPVFLNYIMKNGDDFFDAFIFNSPFLDWGSAAVGGDMFEFALENLHCVTSLTPMTNDFELQSYKTPEGNKPATYLNREIVLNAWSAKLWTQFFFDFRCRPLYSVPVTAGFAKGVSRIHEILLEWRNAKKYVTLKPLVCITSRADDTLTASETLTRIDIVGPARFEIELHYNSHDVFLSEDEKDVKMAIDMVSTWMDSQGFD